MRILLSLIIAIFCCGLSFGQSAQKDSCANLLIIFPDQMRGSAMGFRGEEPVQTPNLDQLAKDGIVLTNAVSNFPICSPARASLMSGKYPQSHGLIQNCNSYSGKLGYEFSVEEECWSDVLNKAGYELGYIGKWHLDNPHEPYLDFYNNKGFKKWNEWTPPEKRHGFNYWYAYGTYDKHLNPVYWSTDAKRDEYNFVDQWGPEHEADKAIAYIKNRKSERDPNKPFVLMVAMNPPHGDYSQVPDKYKQIYEDVSIEELTKRPNIPSKGTKFGDYYRKHIKDYYAQISGVDEQVGRILHALEEAGENENTIVLFISDHGDCLGIHDVSSKDYHYEESMVIPFIIKWPGKLKSRYDDILLSMPDIHPTLLGLMGFEKNIGKDVEGKNYANYLLTGKGKKPTSQLYLYTYYGEPDMGRRGIRTDRYTLMISKRHSEPDIFELFDNKNDPFQLMNIYDRNPILTATLTAQLKNLLMETNDPWIKHLN
ncbi:DUF4976 domain-containing protein [Puteibacter caeruleilacunae]|nr:DUF4976 domain-containing protein [Puteibacter caeruleilacunae]